MTQVRLIKYLFNFNIFKEFKSNQKVNTSSSTSSSSTGNNGSGKQKKKFKGSSSFNVNK